MAWRTNSNLATQSTDVKRNFSMQTQQHNGIDSEIVRGGLSCKVVNLVWRYNTLGIEALNAKQEKLTGHELDDFSAL